MSLGRTVGDKLSKAPIIGRFARQIQENLRQRRKRRKKKALPAPVAVELPPAAPQPQPVVASFEPPPPPTVSDWLDARRSALRPINFFPAPLKGNRISIVTDAVDTSSLFGGVGTSLILAALVANRMRAKLRLITRTVAPDTRACGSVLSANGITLNGPLESVFAPHHGGRQLPVSDGDYFISSGPWWVTRCLLSSVRRDRIAYLLQEDERMFYPFCDERLRCEETLAENDLFTIVNSQLLFDHLTSGTDAIQGLSDRAIWFEPAFPGANAGASRRANTKKRNLFFYARPNNSRNLFATGIEALAGAIERGTFPASEWNIHLVGKEVPDLAFPRGVRPHRVEGLSWAEYQTFVQSMDAGFVLMDTPHPSYPPLDLAAAGAAVLTNSRGNKQSLSRYSDNIMVTQSNVPALRDGLARLAIAARDDATRATRVNNDRICRDWNVALEQTVESVVDRFENGAAAMRPAILPQLRVA